MMSGDTAVHADRLGRVVHVVVAWSLLLLGRLALRLLILALVVLRLSRSSVPVAGSVVCVVVALRRVVVAVWAEAGLNGLNLLVVVLNRKDGLLLVLCSFLFAGDVDRLVERGGLLSGDHLVCLFWQSNFKKL